jgi:FKBP-type peptidyl-prolyl cis-trans isomerase (trigger factor)
MDELHKKPESTESAPTPTESPVESTETVANSPVTSVGEVATQSTASRKNLFVIIAIAVAILIAGGYYFYTAKMADGGPVAVVNGFKIAREEFNNSVEMIKQTASLQGANVEDPQVQTVINEQALDILVNNALLIEGAKNSGITVDDARIEEEYEKLLADIGGEEELTARMAEVGLTQEKLRNNIKERILVDSFLEAETDVENVTATEEEVLALYESFTANAEEGVPSIDELRPQVEEQIKAQKQQAIVNDFLMNLRENADIEIKI